MRLIRQKRRERLIRTTKRTTMTTNEMSIVLPVLFCFYCCYLPLSSSAPIKLVADVPTFVLHRLNHLNFHQNNHLLHRRQVTRSDLVSISETRRFVGPLIIAPQRGGPMWPSQARPSPSSSSSSGYDDEADSEMEDRDMIADATVKHRKQDDIMEEGSSSDTLIAINSTPPAGGSPEMTTPKSTVNNGSVEFASDPGDADRFASDLFGSLSHKQPPPLPLPVGDTTTTIHLPNGQSIQRCRSRGKCSDENAICQSGTCVCKPGYYMSKQSKANLCQSVADLFKNCENDHQCQAVNMDLFCNTVSHERPFCDCAEGFYFDQETYTCMTCTGNIMILQSNALDIPSVSNFNESDAQILRHLAPVRPFASQQVANNKTSAVSGNSTTLAATAASNLTTTTTIIATPTTTEHSEILRPCRPVDQLATNRRKLRPPLIKGQFADYGSPSSGHHLMTTTNDPFKIRTPLEVFMGAIMLFTLFTVAWFFLQRMIHDCRDILRSLRNGDFSSTGDPILTGHSSNGHSLGYSSYLDPTSQAVARLISGDGGYASTLAVSNYQRELAGVMVQHLAGNLSPSSTRDTLVANGTGGRSGGTHLLGAHNDHDAVLYPLTSSASQSRAAAAAAAAQLLWSPTHPAMAILRAAAVSAAQSAGSSDYSANHLLTSMLDPPPKYEEAIAQSAISGNHINLRRSNSPPPPSPIIPITESATGPSLEQNCSPGSQARNITNEEGQQTEPQQEAQCRSGSPIDIQQQQQLQQNGQSSTSASPSRAPTSDRGDSDVSHGDNSHL